jgi:hypothetical protein
MLYSLSNSQNLKVPKVGVEGSVEVEARVNVVAEDQSLLVQSLEDMLATLALVELVLYKRY